MGILTDHMNDKMDADLGIRRDERSEALKGRHPGALDDAESAHLDKLVAEGRASVGWDRFGQKTITVDD